MNHAFICQAHIEPELLKRIVSKIVAPNHFFFINIDKKVDIEPFKDVLDGIPNISFLNDEDRLSVNWGGFSQIACTLRLLKKTLSSPDNIEYVHSISGQDYPIKSNEEFDAFFNQYRGVSFMMYDTPEEHDEWSKPKGKYEERYMRYSFNDIHPTVGTKLVQKVIRLIERFHYLRKPIPNIYAGWSWFTWHRSVVEFVLKYLDKHPAYEKRFHNTSCCDELIFHTMLYPYLKELNIHPDEALRYIDWHPEASYKGTLPKILDERDYNKIINSNAMFCRKVDIKHSAALLDLLAIR